MPSRPELQREPRNAPGRRELIRTLATVGTLAWIEEVAGASLYARLRGANVTIESFADDGTSLGIVSVPRVVRTEAEWRRRLSELAFEVTRRAATEQPFSGTYAEINPVGLYHCVCCDTAQFDSRTKFDSHTGWPSFWRPLSRHNLVQRLDDRFGMQRTAVSCRRCEAHLGHVFNDGPPPTGLRYCMNSVALRFAAHALAHAG